MPACWAGFCRPRGKSVISQPTDTAPAGTGIPLMARLSHEIPKPKDWQAFQRNCVVLFRAELRDPNAMEYGRNGQGQGGIDVLGTRDGRSDHYVGVQCRHVVKPLTYGKMLADCRAALKLNAALKEIIFATTAPDDRKATDAALNVQQVLAAEGHELVVAVYGWAAMQTLIATHETAYLAFCPFVVASYARVPLAAPAPDALLAAQFTAQIVEGLRRAGAVLSSPEVGSEDSAAEDPGLHARIDVYRDLLRVEGEPLIARKGLIALLESGVLEGKPWARFRIETNLAAVAFDLGQEQAAASHLGAAYAARPDDPVALANLGLVRTVQGRFDEAMALARRSMASSKPGNHAVSVLLQAAARSDWKGEPEELIPPELAGTPHADLGLAEFLRRRDVAGWEERSIEIARRHPGVSEFRAMGATAVLSLALRSGSVVPGGPGPVTTEELTTAADDLKALAEHHLEIGYADEHDQVAHLNNACVLLRLRARNPEIVDLLRRAAAITERVPQLRLQLALALSTLGRRAEALAALAGDADPESRLFAAELAAADDPGAALDDVLEIDGGSLDARLAALRWRVMAELALVAGRPEALQLAVEGMRTADPADPMATVLEIRGMRKAGLEEADVRARLLGLATGLPPDADTMTRYFLASELSALDLPEEASSILEGHVDLSRASPAATLYLRCLAGARRDEAFRDALAAAAAEVREDPEILWTAAAHAWNVGDLDAAFAATASLLGRVPDQAQARLLKVEILARSNRSAELMAELDRRIEDLAFGRLHDRFRVASLLGHFGHADRAAAFAYRLFLGHRDEPQAWMTLSTLVLADGLGGETPPGWHAEVAGPDIAVDISFADGRKLFFVIEPDAGLRGLDPESWEQEHPLARLVAGLAVGAGFVGADGREGTITALRHKYVARLHYVLEHYEARFPDLFGFRSISVAPKEPGGLDEFMAQLKARRDWFDQETEEYRNGPWPLAVFAERLGLDTIEAAGGLAARGIQLKVALGNQPERQAAMLDIRENARKGCVLDLLAFWTAWQLGALDAVSAACGPIHVCRSVVDQLRSRSLRLAASERDGQKSASYEGGKISLQEVPPATVAEWRDGTDRAVAWIEANAAVTSVVAADHLPAAFREHLRAGRGDTLDGIAAARQEGLLLVTDDLPTRELARSLGGVRSCWLHHVFGTVLAGRRIGAEQYVRWSAHMVEAGHNYIGVSGTVLALALRLDARAGPAPGRLFRTLVRMIGGSNAEPSSHVATALECLARLWSGDGTGVDRKAATSLLLRRLLNGRHGDYGAILRSVILAVRPLPNLLEFTIDWARGNFIPDKAIWGEKRRPAGE